MKITRERQAFDPIVIRLESRADVEDFRSVLHNAEYGNRYSDANPGRRAASLLRNKLAFELAR